MKTILAHEIDTLSPEIQDEVLKYVENLTISSYEDDCKRMTLDRFQTVFPIKAESKEQVKAVSGNIW